MKTNLPIGLPLSISYDMSPINTDQGIAYAAAILIGLYILIIFEVIFSRPCITYQFLLYLYNIERKFKFISIKLSSRKFVK